MAHLPTTKENFPRHTQEARYTNSRGIAHGRSAQREFPILLGDSVGDLCKGIHVNQAAQQSFPEDDQEDDIDIGDETKHGVEGQEDEIRDLEERGDIEMVDAEERGRRARDENSGLVDGIVGGIKGAEILKWRLVQREE